MLSYFRFKCIMTLIFIKFPQASTDQTNVDIFIPLFFNFVIAMYITVISIFIITCQNSWPTTFLLVPLVWLNIWYRVCGYGCSISQIHC